MATVIIADELLHKAQEAATNAGYETPDSLIEEAIRQKLRQLQSDRSQQLTQRIRDKMNKKGISEQALLADFEKFRQSLKKEMGQ